MTINWVSLETTVVGAPFNAFKNYHIHVVGAGVAIGGDLAVRRDAEHRQHHANECPTRWHGANEVECAHVEHAPVALHHLPIPELWPTKGWGDDFREPFSNKLYQTQQ